MQAPATETTMLTAPSSILTAALRRRAALLLLAFMVAAWLPPGPGAAQQPDIGLIEQRFKQLLEVGDKAAALVEAQKLVAATKAQFGEDASQHAVALTYLGHAYAVQGKHPEAERLFNRALGIAEKALGSSHATVGKIRSNLAFAYRAQDKHADAEAQFKRALAIEEQASGAEHPDLANTLINLADTQQLQKKFAEAEGLFKRALTLKEKALGASHPDVASPLIKLPAP